MSQNETVNKDVIKKEPATSEKVSEKKDPVVREKDDAQVKEPVSREEKTPEKEPESLKPDAPERKPLTRKEVSPEKKAAGSDGSVSEKKPISGEDTAPKRKPVTRKDVMAERKEAELRKAAPVRRPADGDEAGPVRRPVRRREAVPKDRKVAWKEPLPENNKEPLPESNNEGKKKKRRKKPKLLGIYFIYLAVLIILSTVVLAVLWIKLADYQKGIDEKERALAAAPTPTPVPKDETKEAQAAFEKYADSLTAADWAAMWMDNNSSSQDPELLAAVNDYFTKALAEGGTSYYLDLQYDEETPVYKIKIGDKDAARVFMKKADMMGKWMPDGVEVVLQGDYEVQEELPSGMQLLVNKSPVSPTEETADHFPNSSIKDILVNPVVWNVYDVKGLLVEPEVDYENGDDFIWSEDDGCYLALAKDIPDEVTERAEKFFRAYMNYTMSGGAGWKAYRAAVEAGEPNSGNPVAGRFAACVAYVPSDSYAYSMLQKAFDSTCYGLAYTNHDYGLMETRGPVRWADNCIGVDFFYHAYADLNGQRKDYSGGDQVFRVFFINNDGSWKIWAFSA